MVHSLLWPVVEGLWDVAVRPWMAQGFPVSFYYPRDGYALAVGSWQHFLLLIFDLYCTKDLAPGAEGPVLTLRLFL